MSKRKEQFKIFFIVMIVTLLIFSIPVYAETLGSSGVGLKQALDDLIKEYKIHIAGFIGFGVLSGLLAFIVNFMRLGTNSSNSKMRPRIIKELIISAICVVLLGGIPLLYILVNIIVFN